LAFSLRLVFVWLHGQVVFPRAYAELASWHAAHTEQAPELLAAAAEALDLVRTPSHRGWGGHLLLLGAQRVVCVSSTSVVFYYFCLFFVFVSKFLFVDTRGACIFIGGCSLR
jgi:hypothetical protein